MTGISRRELIKRSAVAGGVLWATPGLTSGTAWGATGACDCEGSLVYTKIAGVSGNDAQTCGNQCLQPRDLPSIGFDCLRTNGYVAFTGTSVETATVEFQSKNIALNRMSLKASESCYMVTCTENFGKVWQFGNSENGFPEPKHTEFPDTVAPVPAVFTFEDGDGKVLGDSNTSLVTNQDEVRKITWRSDGLPHKVNFIEFILCARNLSRIPCALGDDC
jgi:hypothetical protein